MSSGVVVPPALVAAMTAIHGARGAAWCADLPALVIAQARRWNVSLGQPFHAEYHWVAPGVRDGREVVLKLGILAPERELGREARILAAWGGRGAVRLLDAELDRADAVALLLERVRPGGNLLALPDEEAMPLLGATAAALHSAGGGRPDVALRPGALADLRAGHPALPTALTSATADLLDELLATSADPVLCHGDLHHGNVLRGPDGAVAIDPRGVWAEPALDVGVALLNPLGTLPHDRMALRALLERRLALICPAMGVDADRGRAWTVVSAVISAVWTAQDGQGVDEQALAVAAVLSD
ncbi:MAG: aminoglycoside phosphotransferase family protein [Kineosporiaceae bacterium]